MVGDSRNDRQTCSSVNIPDASIPKRGEADGSRRPSRLPFFLLHFPSGAIESQHQAADFRPQGLVLLAAQLGPEGLRRLVELLPEGARED